MTKRFTQNERQAIIKDFCRRHGGDFDAKLFEAEVRSTGDAHPAWAWFEWDESAAALEHRVAQARAFAQGLRVSFTIEEIGGGTVVVKNVPAPMLLSPIDGRANGGGYEITDLNRPDHMKEFARQAATSLRSWLNRYAAAIAHAGVSVSEIEHELTMLDAVAGTVQPGAAVAGAATASQGPAAHSS